LARTVKADREMCDVDRGDASERARSGATRRRLICAFLAFAILVPGIVASSFTDEAAARATTFTAKITKAAISSANRSATFYFIASGGVANRFQCSLALKGKVAKVVSCLSPEAYTNLALHEYTFGVYAQHCNTTVCENSTTVQRSFRIN
jgi:hypothetical protein